MVRIKLIKSFTNTASFCAFYPMRMQFALSLNCYGGAHCRRAESRRDPYSHKSIIHIIHTILMRHMYLSELSPCIC